MWAVRKNGERFGGEELGVFTDVAGEEGASSVSRESEELDKPDVPATTEE